MPLIAQITRFAARLLAGGRLRLPHFGREPLLKSYRPERHYMRGPGPQWRAKHGAPDPLASRAPPSR
jgi:hypothetical protein